MREILFRGKWIDNGEWVEGWLYKRVVHLEGCHQNVVVDAIEVYDGKSPLSIAYYSVAPDTVGQYTGLKDKNGKRIFEGDIVRIVERGKTADGGIIVFENGYPGGWLVTDSKGESKCSLAMRTDVEVIGNIHDNPELMDGGAENED